MSQNGDPFKAAQDAVQNLRQVLLAARKVHTPDEYKGMSEPILLELQQREHDILTYLSQKIDVN